MGHNLIDQVTNATGLPKEMIGEELKVLIQKSGKDMDKISLDDLRAVLAEYVQDVLLHAKDQHGSDKPKT